jgi:hypothetical protein
MRLVNIGLFLVYQRWSYPVIFRVAESSVGRSSLSGAGRPERSYLAQCEMRKVTIQTAGAERADHEVFTDQSIFEPTNLVKMNRTSFAMPNPVNIRAARRWPVKSVVL